MAGWRSDRLGIVWETPKGRSPRFGRPASPPPDLAQTSVRRSRSRGPAGWRKPAACLMTDSDASPTTPHCGVSPPGSAARITLRAPRLRASPDVRYIDCRVSPKGGRKPTFFIDGPMKDERKLVLTQVESIARELATSLGLEVVEFVFRSQGRHSLLRIDIDRAGMPG